MIMLHGTFHALWLSKYVHGSSVCEVLIKGTVLRRSASFVVFRAFRFCRGRT